MAILVFAARKASHQFELTLYSFLILSIAASSGLFGTFCIIRPKFGSLSRAMGLGFIGTAILLVGDALFTSPARLVLPIILWSAGCVWCGVECFRKPRFGISSRAIGVAFILVGLFLQYLAVSIAFQ